MPHGQRENGHLTHSPACFALNGNTVPCVLSLKKGSAHAQDEPTQLMSGQRAAKVSTELRAPASAISAAEDMAAPSFLCGPCVFVQLILLPLSTTGRVDRHVTATLGSGLRLTCSTKPWSETISAIWEVDLKTGGKCTVGTGPRSRFVDTCQDGKTQLDTPDGVPYLHIPDIQLKDEGIYSCLARLKKGLFRLKTRVTIEATTEALIPHKIKEEGITVKGKHYASSVAPESQSSQMFCIKEVKSEM
ncbi:hypothetical protein SKAU_G00259340 [Synaphobranchus kaupii]|uniref:Ig-like domain-containing protein n=1 Tax=Synaphobranchus kaupii TaxID=118154 RepID=A0A9Q1F4F0_SYNKA|nr:hypothetical protein SKAU_G00259340 [Synaphobranchus kaupii]